MKIAVLVKQVPDSESKIKIANDAIDENDIKWIINPYDEIAIEAALQLKEKTGGEVVIITAGGPRAVETMRQALAMGADRGIRIDTTGMTMDPWLTATVLTHAVKQEGAEVVFAGKQAIDDDAQQVHIGVAEMMAWPHVSPIEKFELNAGNKSARVERPVAGGLKEVIDVEFPAVFGCEKGLSTPRYASLPGIMKAKSKPIAELKAAELLAGQSPAQALSHFTLPPEGRAGKMLKGTSQEMAKELVRLLREEAKVI